MGLPDVTGWLGVSGFAELTGWLGESGFAGCDGLVRREWVCRVWRAG